MAKVELRSCLVSQLVAEHERFFVRQRTTFEVRALRADKAGDAGRKRAGRRLSVSRQRVLPDDR